LTHHPGSLSYKSIEFRIRVTVFVIKYNRTVNYLPKLKKFKFVQTSVIARRRSPTHLPTYPRYQWRSIYFVPWSDFIKYYIFGDLLLKCSDPLRYHRASVPCTYCGNTLVHSHLYTHPVVMCMYL